jgi:hypothetical protein
VLCVCQAEGFSEDEMYRAKVESWQPAIPMLDLICSTHPQLIIFEIRSLIIFGTQSGRSENIGPQNCDIDTGVNLFIDFWDL